MRNNDTPALALSNVSVRYGAVTAVNDISFNVAPGEIVTIIGPNGAGKTTLLNGIAGLLPTSGAIRLYGTNLRGMRTYKRVEMGVGIVPEQRELFGSMTVEDNLHLGTWTTRRNKKSQDSLAHVFEMFPRLAERRKQFAATLSGGERQMLALGRALLSEPKVLLLDEPSQGLAPMIVAEIFQTIGALRSLGIAIVVVEQNARIALRYASYGYVLENGVISLEGDPATLQNDSRVVDSYLGRAKVEASKGKSENAVR